MLARLKYMTATLGLMASVAQAESHGEIVTAEREIVTAEILPGWRQTDGTHMTALRLTLAPGWKTFWRAPGDAGIPPRFDTNSSENLETMHPVWPRPDVFVVSGMRTVGYERELILPLAVEPQDANAPILFEGHIDIGICSDVCVPATLPFAAELPPSGESDARIVAALVDVPFTSQEAGVQAVHCYTGPVQYGMGLRAEITLPRMRGEETVVVEAADPMIWVAEPRVWWEGEVLVAETEMSHVEERGFVVDENSLRFTVIADGMAVDIQGCATR